MRLHLLLAATLAAFFVVGCSSEKSIAPKVLAATTPQQEPLQPSADEASAPEPKADPPPTPTASLPTKGQEPAKDKSTAPRPDPWADLTPELVPYYEQVNDMLEPVRDAAKEMVKGAFQPEWSEDEKRKIAVVRLGLYRLPLRPKEETELRALLAKAERPLLTGDYFMVAEPEQDRLLAAAYERAIDEGADIPAGARKKLADWLKSSDPDLLRDLIAAFRKQWWWPPPRLAEETGYIRRKILEQNLFGSALFRLASHLHAIGQSLVEERERCRTVYDLVMALPEPHRSDVLTKVAWSPEQEADLDREREKLKEVKLSHVNRGTLMWRSENRFWCKSLLARELRAFAADRYRRFLALERKRRDTIEECFHHVDASRWKTLEAIDELIVGTAGFQSLFDQCLSDLGYRFRPLIPPNARPNVLPKIPLSGSAEDRIPTIRINDDSEIVFDPPAKPRIRTVASPTDKPPPPQDPYAGVDAAWKPSYEQFKELLEPSVTASGSKAQRGAERHVSEDEEKKLAVVQLGQYKVSLNREAERRLRALLADIKSTETEAYGTKYLAAVDALIAGPAKARILAAAYEEAINEGADIPADLRQKLAELIRANDPQGPHARGPSYTMGSIAQQAEALQTKLPQQSVAGNDLLRLALSVYALGQSVIERRTRCRTFHDLVTGLPEPYRSDVLTKLAWSPEQEADLDREREKLKEVKPSHRNPKTVRRMPNGRYQYDIKRIEFDYASELRWIVADRQNNFRVLEKKRRDTIEGCFQTVDAPGWEAFMALDVLVAEVQVVLDAILPDLSYRLRPLIPDRFDLQFMSWRDGSGVPTSGNNLVIVGTDNNGLLHLRIFDVDGKHVADTDETKLPGTQAGAISLLKSQLLFSPPDELTGAAEAEDIAAVTAIVDQTLPHDAPWGAASNVLAKIPLRGSVEDRVPTISVSDDVIVFDAPAGQLTYANALRPGNVLVGTLCLPEQSQPGDMRETTYHAELHIGAVENKVVRGELVVDAQRYPFQGEIRPAGFFFEAELGTFQGSLEKGWPLTGQVLRHSGPAGSFSFALKK